MATASTAVPDSSLPKVTWKGAYPSVPTLISRKLNPQMSESPANRIRQSRAGRRAAGAVAVADGSGGRGGREGGADAGAVALGSQGALMRSSLAATMS